jgi:hypothetical protein
MIVCEADNEADELADDVQTEDGVCTNEVVIQDVKKVTHKILISSYLRALS